MVALLVNHLFHKVLAFVLFITAVDARHAFESRKAVYTNRCKPSHDLVPHGRLDVEHLPEMTAVGGCIKIRCDSGYKLASDDNDALVCRADGTWMQSAKCVRSCLSQPPVVPHAQVNVSGTPAVVGTVVHYSCYDGYLLSGGSMAVCRDDGTWSDPPACLQACNPNDASIDNGGVATTGRVYGVGNVIPVTCDAGHVLYLEQDAGLTCGEGGTWLPTARCVRSCSGQPPAVENGRPDRQLTVTATGVSAFYTCNSKYVLVGGQSVVCQADGTWSDPPRCLRECHIGNVNVDHGTPVPRAAPFLEGDTVEVVCESGYVWDKCGCTRYTCQADGTWQGEVTCRRISPFTCVPGEECTNAIERDGYSWRLCEGSATGGCHPSQGRMEISLDGGSTWLGVCRSRWDREANLPVACRMLGFRYGIAHGHFSADTFTLVYGIGNTQCDGYEDSLVYCPGSIGPGVNVTGCLNSDIDRDVGIICGMTCDELY